MSAVPSSPGSADSTSASHEPGGSTRSSPSQTRTGGTSSAHGSPESSSTRTFAKLRRAGENDPSPESWAETGLAPTVDSVGHGPRTATLVCYAEVSPAKTSPSPDEEPDSPASGRGCSTSS